MFELAVNLCICVSNSNISLMFFHPLLVTIYGSRDTKHTLIYPRYLFEQIKNILNHFQKIK